MNLDEIIKSMQSLQEEVAKTNETIEQINQSLKSMNDELGDTHDKEKEEVEAVRSKWASRREELTREISDATQKKQFVEDSSKSLNEAVKVIEALFLIQKESIPKEDVKDEFDILRIKYEDSEFESVGAKDLCPGDFDEFEEKLNLVSEQPNRVDSEEPEQLTGT